MSRLIKYIVLYYRLSAFIDFSFTFAWKRMKKILVQSLKVLIERAGIFPVVVVWGTETLYRWNKQADNNFAFE